MPELPEVETIVRRLSRRLPGRTVVRAEVRRPNVVRGPARRLERAVRGATIDAVGRRGKFLVFRLSDGRVWWSHLRMSGKWRLERPGRARDDGSAAPDEEYVRAVFELDDGQRLSFVDVRTLGEMEVVSAAVWLRRESGMGPEPLDPAFTADLLRERLSTSRRVVKEFLLDQSKIAGIGNIYAAEALWRARVSPRRVARNLGPERARRLHRAIVDVLTEAVGRAGTSLGETYLNYADSEGERGSFQDFLAVYDREGAPCRRCGTRIRRIVQGQRSTCYCPHCQR